MKCKASLWLNIVTICFCICAIAVGVYSATTASITASGKIGFVAHGCNVDITGTIQGHATENKPDGVPVKTPESLGDKVEVRGDAKTLSIGSRYFSDMESTTGKPEDIIMLFTIKNVSVFTIEATLNQATKLPDNVKVTREPEFLTIESNQEAVFKIILSLEPINNNYNSITMPTSDNIEISMEFDRVDDNIIKYDSANNYYYIEMGVNPYKDNEPLRWISFAKKQENGTFDFYDKKNKPTNGTFYFISELILYSDGESSQAASGGIPYQNDYVYTDTNSAFHIHIDNKNYQAQDYAVSNVRTYLNGGTVYNSYSFANNTATPAGEQVSISNYEILTSNIYKKYIVPRYIAKIYEKTTFMIDYANVYDCAQEADKLWLLSYNLYQITDSEGNKLLDTDSELNWVINNYGYGGTTTNYDSSKGTGTTTAYWWGRSPNSGAVFSAVAVSPEGGKLVARNTTEALGVRPGFKITL